MGVGIAVILVLVAVMITPLAYSYTEKQEIELERLLTEYIIKEPNEGGPPEVELVDFEKLAQDEIDSLREELVELQLVIDVTLSNVKTQNEIIQKENVRVAQAQQKVQEDWSAPPVDTTQLKLEYEKLNTLTNELEILLSQKDLILKKINTKELLQEIKVHDAKLIGVRISDNCIIMAKLGNSTCPTYEDLVHLDSSNQEISGKFSLHDGWYHREKSQFTDSFRFYDTEDEIRIIVDPHWEISSRIKMITIESDFGLFTDAYDRKLTEGYRVMQQGRVIENCYTANISSDNYKMLLPDTIFTFRNGCESAEISDKLYFNMPLTKIDKSTSPNVQHQQWLKEAKLNCKELC